MIASSTRVVVYSVLVNLLLCVSAAPFSTQDVLEVFINPFKDIKSLFFANVNNSSNDINAEPVKERKDDEADGKMIDVPPNTEDCGRGTQRDVGGVCRTPWT